MNFVTGSYSFHMCFSVTISLIVTFFHMLIFQNFTQVSGISKNYLVTIKGILFNPRKSTWCKKASCYYCFCQRHTCDKMQKYTSGTWWGQPLVTLTNTGGTGSKAPIIFLFFGVKLKHGLQIVFCPFSLFYTCIITLSFLVFTVSFFLLYLSHYFVSRHFFMFLPVPSRVENII